MMDISQIAHRATDDLKLIENLVNNTLMTKAERIARITSVCDEFRRLCEGSSHDPYRAHPYRSEGTAS
ncbi:MAG TPA: hypothetical protein VF062_00030 [Candidatus Limnocylindrales bacterium]